MPPIWDVEETMLMPPKRSLPANGGSTEPPVNAVSERVTIQDVAKAAGVSNSSVSNYMNGRLHRLGPETRTRIADAISGLGFRPNQAARQLKTGKTHGIALVVPSIVNPFNGQLVFAIEQAAVRAGYGVHLCNTMRDAKVEKGFLENLVGIGVTYLITIAPLNTRRGYYAGQNDLSVVAIDAIRSDLRLPKVDTINLDHESAIALAVEHLFALGHRRIAYVTDPLITYSRVMRLSGFRKAMEEHDLSADLIVLLDEAHGARDIADAEMVDVGRNAAPEVLKLEVRPTAVIAFNDMIALGLMASFRQAGMSVPGDISIVGIDDVWVSQLSYPGLTTVRQPIEAMGAAAVERITNPSAVLAGAGTDTLFLPELIIRQSCGKPPRPSGRVGKPPEA
ncbi:LacI family transcriptional regulator [Rhizobium laguerreae]|uniref:LacI family DNA-binding transcriptional regulator n=1 Tax=Rhizobium laguerreae TaxID=1076926 RepID=UPI001C91799B|nr:LacI family DNA-binding transcriptional regulator [Rhizobium laguerreae]MBY3304690.1 LacI family transcriptional regulator [Rhizobium laguerreae]